MNDRRHDAVAAAAGRRRLGDGHLVSHLHHQAGDERVDEPEVGREPDDLDPLGRGAGIDEADRLASEGVGHLVHEDGLLRDVRASQDEGHRLGPVAGPVLTVPPQQGFVDGVSRHQFGGLGPEGGRLLGELGRLGLGQQGADRGQSFVGRSHRGLLVHCGAAAPGILAAQLAADRGCGGSAPTVSR